MRAEDGPATKQPPLALAWSDVAVAAVVFLLNVSTAWMASARPGEPDLTIGAVGLLAGQSVALLARRRHPVLALIGIGLFAAPYGIADWPDPLAPLAPFVALVSVFENARRRTALVLFLISAVVAVIATAAPTDSDALDWGVMVLSLVLAPVVGEVLRDRRTALAGLEARNEAMQAEQAVAVETARSTERQQIARELHDVVTHHVTMLVVQAEAGASQAELMSGAERVAAFDEMAASGRAALVELRQLLGVLRDPADGAPSAPTPGIRRIDDLVERARTTGLDIDYRVPSAMPDLPASVDLASYRVVQEGLTNVIRHAGATRAFVAVTIDDTAVDVEVTDDGEMRSPSPAADGIGLTGLRERIMLLGGSVDAGRRPDGGFRLHARIPTEARP